MDIWDPIAADSPVSASKLDLRFKAAAAGLSDNPQMGKPGLVRGTRELFPHPSYRLVYEHLGDAVWVLALMHTSRAWPPFDAP